MFAPFEYLNRRYDGDLAVLWYDAHADWSTTDDWPHFNAMAVRALVRAGSRPSPFLIP
jgi:arginase